MGSSRFAFSSAVYHPAKACMSLTTVNLEVAKYKKYKAVNAQMWKVYAAYVKGKAKDYDVLANEVPHVLGI